MIFTLKNARIYMNNKFTQKDILVSDGRISEIDTDIEEGRIIDCKNKLVAPAFIDPHVHGRQPGYEYKETIATVTRAAARGGYTKIFLMPNLKPVPSNLENLNLIFNIIKKDALIDCYQLASITKNQSGKDGLSDIEKLAPYVVGFSDDGKGVVDSATMYEAMLKAKEYKRAILAHAEDESLLYGGVIHKGKISEEQNIPGILSASETVQVARDLVLAEATKVHYHLCHVSAKETLSLVKYFKDRGVNVTVEATPHHILLNEEDLKDDGIYKVNPPLRSKEDQEAIIKALQNGVIDMIATDHAPHSEEEKNKGLLNSSFGMVGIETSFGLLYTYLVKQKKISLEKLLDMMSLNVSKAFGIESNQIKVGNSANLVVIDLEKEFIIDKNKFVSKGKNTPFNGYRCFGQIIMTISKGEIIYELL